MIKFIYVKRDKKAKFYDSPVFVDYDPKTYTEVCSRALVRINDPKQKAIYNDCELYYIGQFDDTNGQFNLVKEEKLFDFSDFLGDDHE